MNTLKTIILAMLMAVTIWIGITDLHSEAFAMKPRNTETSRMFQKNGENVLRDMNNSSSNLPARPQNQPPVSNRRFGITNDSNIRSEIDRYTGGTVSGESEPRPRSKPSR